MEYSLATKVLLIYFAFPILGFGSRKYRTMVEALREVNECKI